MRTVMMSCVQRREERARTIASLKQYGLSPIVAESPCDPACRKENRRVGVEALSHHDGTGVLFCEDDLRANDRLPHFLGMAVESDLVAVMCNIRERNLRDTTKQEIHSGLPMRPRLEVAPAHNWFGTQCVYLPPRVVTAIESSPWRAKSRPTGHWDGFDFLVRDVIVEMGETLFVALPNPVQHTAPPSCVPGKAQQRRSLTADRPTDRPASEATIDT